ncbi:MAG: pyrroline-5-carboxylate reductase [Thermoplasmata archaeon]
MTFINISKFPEGMKQKVAVIGAGTIGSAVAIALMKNGYGVIATRRRKEKIQDLEGKGIEICSDNRRAVQSSDIIIISLKPMDAVSEIKRLSEDMQDKILISLAAALPVGVIKKFSRSYTVRAMTNIAARVGGGFTVYCFDDEFPEERKMEVRELLSSFGKIEEVEEKYMDALTALSGSGPAYILTVIESMMYAGLKVGLPRELALKASYETVLGAAKLVGESGDHPSILKELVITPAGVTIDAIYELEDSGIRTAFMRAIESATKKSETITKNIIEKFNV